MGLKAPQSLWMILLLVAALPGSGSAQQGSVAESCLLQFRPLWEQQAETPSQLARGWRTADRGVGACDPTFGGWFRTSLTSGAPVERPDGLAAPGLGLVASGSAGVAWGNERFDVRIAPEFAWHQNDDIAVPVLPFDDARRFRYPWRILDWPSRFGTDSFTQAGLGSSGIRVNFANLSAGVDAAPVRWGPSRRYPLLLSGQQGDLPRVGLRTEQPWDLGTFGTVDFNVLWSRLVESEWFDQDDETETRIMGGFMLAWAPDLLPGLELGLAALHHQYSDDFGFGSVLDFLQSPSEETGGNADGNGLASLWMRWSRPESGFDVWLEVAKDDYSSSFSQLILEPEHSSARTFGLRQEVDWGSDRLAVHFETTVTRNAEPLVTDGDGIRAFFYSNNEVREGHTNRGQMLGTFLGPGGDAQFLEVRLTSASSTALQIERMRWNTDAYTQEIGEPFGDEGYDVEMVGRVIHERTLGPVRALGELEIGTRHNRFFLQDQASLGWDGNTRLSLTLLWDR